MKTKGGVLFVLLTLLVLSSPNKTSALTNDQDEIYFGNIAFKTNGKIRFDVTQATKVKIFISRRTFGQNHKKSFKRLVVTKAVSVKQGINNIWVGEHIKKGGVYKLRIRDYRQHDAQDYRYYRIKKLGPNRFKRNFVNIVGDDPKHR